MSKNTGLTAKKAVSFLLLLSIFVTSSPVVAKASGGNSTESFQKYLAERDRAYSLLLDEPSVNVKTKNDIINTVYGSKDGVAAIPKEFEGEKSVFISSDLDFSNSITQFELPDTTTAILSSENGKLDNKGAFYGNAKLKTVIPSRKFLYVGNKAFYGAKSLEYFFFPYLIRHIGDYAFAYCQNLSEVSVYGNTSIGDGAFAGCSNLSDIYLSERVTRVGLDAFIHTPFYDTLTDEFGMCGDILIKYNGKGGDIVIPEGVRVIADGVFAGRLSITSVTFPESLKYIGNSAFRSCANLEDVFLNFRNGEESNNLTLGENSFDGCSLSENSLSIIENLPADERNLTITETNRDILNKPPVSIINFIQTHNPFAENTKEENPFENMQLHRLPVTYFLPSFSEVYPQVSSKEFPLSNPYCVTNKIPYKQKSGVSLS